MNTHTSMPIDFTRIFCFKWDDIHICIRRRYIERAIKEVPVVLSYYSQVVSFVLIEIILW